MRSGWILDVIAQLLSIAVLLVVSTAVGEPRRPPNYHHDHMPETSFTCGGKVVGGYYADPDADCQMFHVCVQVDENDVRDFKFMCPDDTVFDQENFICANWFEIDCRSSTLFYDKNLQLFQPNEADAAKKAAANATTEEPSEQQRRQQLQQVQQLQVLEEQQQQQVLRQQQVLQIHEKRQQEHQRQQIQILQDQQRQLEKLRPEGRKIPGSPQTPSKTTAKPATTTTTTTTTTTQATTTDQADESVVEYDYYYYDYDESTEHGHFYLNDEYDPKAPSRIIDPTNAKPPLLPISAPAKPSPPRPSSTN